MKSVVFKLGHKIVKFSLKDTADMQSKKEVTGMKDLKQFVSDNQGTPALSLRLPILHMKITG